MIDLRSDLFEVRATKAILEKELHNLLLQLHAAQLQLHAKTGTDTDSETIMKKLVSSDPVGAGTSVLFGNVLKWFPKKKKKNKKNKQTKKR